MALEFRPARSHDLETIRALADRIWHVCYPGIITPEQIRYMLGWMYAPHKLAAEFARGVSYELAWLDGLTVGYLAYELQPGGTVLHLNKLYLVPELHGRGLGRAMLDRVEAVAGTAGVAAIELRVNRGNQRALRAYERAGFEVVDAVRQEIGGGFVMDDFVLRRQLVRSAALKENAPA